MATPALHPISAIFFDTQPLFSHWPSVSGGVKQILDLARTLEIPVYLPVAVERELERQFVRRLEDAHANTVTAHNRFRRAVGAGADYPALDLNGALTEFRVRVDELKRNHDIRTVPITVRSTGDLFELAVQRLPPFKVIKNHKDAGFKDAVIAFSVIDALHNCYPPYRAVLVTADTGFSGIQQHTKRTLDVALVDEVLESLRTGKALADLANGSFVVRGTLSADHDGQGPGFDLVGEGIHLVNYGGEYANVGPYASTPCGPGERVNVYTQIGGSFMGTGPASLAGNDWKSVYYSGHLIFDGPPMQAPSASGVVRSTFTCQGQLAGHPGSPMGDVPTLFRVSVTGSGTVEVWFKVPPDNDPLCVYCEKVAYVLK